MTDQEKQLLAAVQENPRDWDLRKILADFLEDDDRPSEADVHRGWDDAKQDKKEAVEWFENFSARTLIPVDRILKLAIEFVACEEPVFHFAPTLEEEMNAMEAANELMHDPQVLKDFWKHFSVLMADVEVPPVVESLPSGVFTCGCGSPPTAFDDWYGEDEGHCAC